jgi:hypothetical protein
MRGGRAVTRVGAAVSGAWLRLREPADAGARSRELVDRLVPRLPRGGVIHDLACGTGAMGRWLAPLLPGEQHWVLHDVDAGLLRVAATDVPVRAADGAAVTAEPRRSDITLLGPGDVADASLITTSALLDLLTRPELDRLVAAWATVGCPALLTLSVTGRVELDPPHPLDAPVGAAFNAHQRRTTARGRLLGPDAPDAAAEQFAAAGAEVTVRPSLWRLGPGQGGLVTEWLAGRLDAACEQDARLQARRAAYESGRLSQLAAGELRVTVHHADMLALPG